MTFVHPFAYLLLALAVVPILLYILPMPRRRMSMPSLILWRRMLRDRPSSESWRWLRTLLSCLLQVVILVLLALAVGKPVFTPAGGEGELTIIVLDRSASMKAPLSAEAADGETRFESARALARRIVNGMSSGKRAAVVAVGTVPVVVSGPTDRRAAVIDAIDALSCTEGRTDMKTAVTLALQLARGEQSADVYVISDGAADLSSVRLDGAKLHYFRIGKTVPNVGIVAFQARRGIDNPQEYQALVRIQSTFDEPRDVELSLVMDDEVIETRTVTVPADGTLDESFPAALAGKKVLKLAPGGEGVLSVKITSVDAFAPDDAAYALLGPPEKADVALVSEKPDRFLASALSVNRRINAYAPSMDDCLKNAHMFEVITFKGKLPSTLPAGNLFIIDPDASCALFDVTGDSKNLKPTDWDREHPVLAGVTLKDIYIPVVRNLTPKPEGWAVVLARAGKVPLLLAGEESGRRVVVLPFDPERSSMTFRIAFPVLVSNALSWLAGEADASEREMQSGTELRLALARLESPTVTRPDGRKSDRAPEDGELVISASEVGIYTIELREGTLTYAANLTDATESNLTVAAEMTFADAVVAGRDSGEAGFGELWFIAAFTALALLSLEWFLYHHRFVV